MIRELTNMPGTACAGKGLWFLPAIIMFFFAGFFTLPHLALGASPAGKHGDTRAGKVIYDRHCHYCHGRKGYGDGPVGTAITPHPADFVHDSKRMRKSDGKLFKSIRDGVQRKIGGEAMAMPRWANILTEDDIWDVLAYIRELEKTGRVREGLDSNGYKGAAGPPKSKKR